MTILQKIVQNRKSLISTEKEEVSLNDLQKKAEEYLASNIKPVNFINKVDGNKPFLIAEIKKASPSRGLIRKDFEVTDIAGTYNNSNHVNAISILTEPDYFQGSYEYIKTAKSITRKPVLMKDFIIDRYQIYKGFLYGASAVLVIASIMEDREIQEFIKITSDLNLDILFEVHTESEYKRALNFDIKCIGINNRDLKTFKTDINNTVNIIRNVGKPKDRIIISESGIHAKEDIAKLWENSVDGFLIGERFMKYHDIDRAITDLFGDRDEAATN